MLFETLQSQPKRAWGLTSCGAFDWRSAKAVDLGAQRRKGGQPPGGKNGLYGFASRTRTLEKRIPSSPVGFEDVCRLYYGQVSSSVPLTWKVHCFYFH